MVELDVRLTADGVPVILHDLDVGITTDGSGLVHMLTFDEVRGLDASGGRGDAVTIPTLEEALELLSGRVGIDIEIKNLPGEASFDSPREAIAERVVELLDRTAFSGEVIVSSFNWLSIEHVRRLDPSIPTGFLTQAFIDPFAALVYARSEGHAFVLPQVPAVVGAGATFVEQAHADGIRVGTWVADDEDVIRELFEMGVDAVASNDPVTAVRVRDEFRRRRDPQYSIGRASGSSSSSTS